MKRAVGAAVIMSPYQFIAAIITPLQSKYAQNLIINAVTTAKIWKARGQKNYAGAKKDLMILYELAY